MMKTPEGERGREAKDFRRKTGRENTLFLLRLLISHIKIKGHPFCSNIRAS